MSNPKSHKKQKRGPGKNQQKLLILLWGGLALGMTRSPFVQYRVMRGMVGAWKEVDRGNLSRTVNSLHAAGLVRYQTSDNNVTVVLTNKGKEVARRYHHTTLRIAKPKKWDSKWRVVMYDIPEKKRDLRLALSRALFNLGFLEVQQSVYVHPYECRKEVRHLVREYEADPYVRFMLADHIEAQEELIQSFRSSERALSPKKLTIRTSVT